MYKSIPKEATIAVTYKCNARCQMCGIWQMTDTPELTLDYIKNLNRELRYINLTGGEPFLRFDLPEVVKEIKKACPKSEIIISSNGFNSELISERVKNILSIDKNIGVRISIDGSKETHNKIRGIEIYDEAVKTAKNLKSLGVKNVGIAMTASDANAGEIKSVYDLSKELRVKFSISLVQNSSIYFSSKNNKINIADDIENGFQYIIKKRLSTWNVMEWLKAYFVYGLIYFLKNNKPLFSSGAGNESLFIDARGDIFPSNLVDIKLANIGDGQLEKLWQSKEVKQKRAKARFHKYADNWTICTMREALKKHWLKAGLWILKNKFLKK